MKNLLLRVRPGDTALAVMEGETLSDFLVEEDDADIVGRVYKGVIKNVVPALNGMFIDIGIGRNAFLRTKDIATKEPHTEGASVLVQVEKDSTETKGPLVTEEISFAGKYAVALLHSSSIGVSKKIKSAEKREKLRSMARDILPAHMGAIVRTAAVAAPEDAFRRDMDNLFHMADIVEKRWKVAKGPALLYRDADLAVKALRDYMDDSVEAFYVDDRDTWQRLTRMAEEEGLAAKKIHLYTDPLPLFTAFHAEEEIQQLFDRVVPLKSGGSLVIDYTEALTAIDVNSGSFKGHMPHSELAYAINKEAAKEIARQIRLRGIGGMILVDFIDMDSKAQQEGLLQCLREAVRSDRTKTVVCGMTTLGLVEMTRKRTARRLWQNYFDTCPLCHGTGRTPSARTVAGWIADDLETRKAAGPFTSSLLIRCHKEVADVLQTPAWQERLQRITGRIVSIDASDTADRGVYSIEAKE